MDKIIKVLAFLLLIISFHNLHGQEYRKMVKLSYSAGYPVGNLGNYVEGKLFDGVAVEGRYFIKENISIGISTGWNSFSDRFERQVYPYQNGEISAVQTRYFRSIPALLTGHYYFEAEDAKFRPYAGLGIGGFQMRYEKWYGVFVEGQEKWTVGIRPELGVLIPFGDKVGVDFNLRYNYALYSFNEIENFHFAEANLGLFLKIY